ncbi:DUF3347 domain-containing protein [Pedobacter sp. HMF7647]|uniref:DUF3347 domain-containing protein n=1 Tax=Hufsiella arboris TaxID=2695275 RepID=A0A7K1Y7H9_9SPHI|nr:DUF3347 domain-containing protein [Hufsiella arboris]MXV50525.1 DUF3347 domain-containing protein [Hufsiella arboris]
MMFKHFFYLLLGVSVISCNQTENKSEEKVTVSADSTRNNSTILAGNDLKVENAALTDIYATYIQLKDDLVKSDSKEAANVSAKLAGQLKDNNDYLKIVEKANDISKTDDLKKQRLYFSDLSDEMIKAVKASKVESGKAFVQYCPMAKNGEGAYWLASEKEIRNPYYGDEMLNCGDVKEEITKK